MKIIDAHCHIFPEKIAAKASDSIGSFYEFPMYAPASSGELLKAGERIGTDLFMVSSSAVTPDQVVSINDFIGGECRKHSSFFGLGALHYQYEDIEGELDRIEELGLHGIKFHNDFQNCDIDEPDAIPMYRAIARRKLPVLFHMGDDKRTHTTPRRLRNLMEQVPDLKVIAAHFGGYRAWDSVTELPVCDNIRFDTSSSLEFISRNKAHDLFDYFGIDKFFFGTDFPMWDPLEEMCRFKALGLSPAEEDKILHRNFEDFFEL